MAITDTFDITVRPARPFGEGNVVPASYRRPDYFARAAATVAALAVALGLMGNSQKAYGSMVYPEGIGNNNGLVEARLGFNNLMTNGDVPEMTVLTEVFKGEYDVTHTGNEQKINYLFQNVSNPGDINNMISAAIHSNQDMGIYKVQVFPDMDSFTTDYLTDNTVLSLSDGLLWPGGDGMVTILSSYMNTTTGWATATASGIMPPGVPFYDQNYPSNQYVPVDIPAVPEPATITMLALGGVGLLLRNRRRACSSIDG